MTSEISPRIRSLLVRSLPLVQNRRDALVEAMERSLVPMAGEFEAFGQAEMTARVLVELLIEQVRTLVESGALGRLDEVRPEHRALDIHRRHYSRFGDALIPALKDILGPLTPREVGSAWCDTFWAIIQAAHAPDGPPPPHPANGMPALHELASQATGRR